MTRRGLRSKRRKYGSKMPDFDESSSTSVESTPTRRPNGARNVQVGGSNAQGNPSLLSLSRSVLLVSSTALVCFAAARNSITWHCQRFWGASGDFWQAQWDKFSDTVGEDPFTLWVYGTAISSTSVYWIFGGIYTISDVTKKPAASRRYKIQPGTNEPVDRKKSSKVIWSVLLNQFAVGSPCSFFFYYMMWSRGSEPVRESPTFHWVLYELAIHILVEEAGFYYSHRFLHSRYSYKTIHKQHHEWTAPIAVTAIYCHPIEHIFSNSLPPFLGVSIMGSHVATSWLWFTSALLSTLNAHSGYHSPFFPSPEAHDFHHSKFNNCFGVSGVSDRSHGTDSSFRSTRAYQRHIMMSSFVPPREAYPEPDTCSKHKSGKQ